LSTLVPGLLAAARAAQNRTLYIRLRLRYLEHRVDRLAPELAAEVNAFLSHPWQLDELHPELDDLPANQPLRLCRERLLADPQASLPPPP
jgi:hypothetical protein